MRIPSYWTFSEATARKDDNQDEFEQRCFLSSLINHSKMARRSAGRDMRFADANELRHSQGRYSTHGVEPHCDSATKEYTVPCKRAY